MLLLVSSQLGWEHATALLGTAAAEKGHRGHSRRPVVAISWSFVVEWLIVIQCRMIQNYIMDRKDTVRERLDHETDR